MPGTDFKCKPVLVIVVFQAANGKNFAADLPDMRIAPLDHVRRCRELRQKELNSLTFKDYFYSAIHSVKQPGDPFEKGRR